MNNSEWRCQFKYMVISFLFTILFFNQVNSQNLPVKIGLLVEKDTASDPSSREWVRVASLAVKDVNRKGGINGQPVSLVFRSCDGRWGAGSKQAVELIYDENVSALIAAVNGQNAHLAEQVATKAQVVLLSTQAHDPTLSQINIPWFFRVNPTDIQISDALSEQQFAKEGKRDIAIIAGESYDNRSGKDNLVKALSKMNVSLPEIYSMDRYVQLKPQAKTIVFFGDGKDLKRLVKNTQGKVIFYCSSSFTELQNHNSNQIFIPVFEDWYDDKINGFKKHFFHENNYYPHFQSAYVYDGVQLVLSLFGVGSRNHEELKNDLRKVRYKGITGEITFDNAGNRQGKVKFISHSQFH